jgi:hypothetical protein
MSISHSYQYQQTRQPASNHKATGKTKTLQNPCPGDNGISLSALFPIDCRILMVSSVLKVAPFLTGSLRTAKSFYGAPAGAPAATLPPYGVSQADMSVGSDNSCLST